MYYNSKFPDALTIRKRGNPAVETRLSVTDTSYLKVLQGLDVPSITSSTGNVSIDNPTTNGALLISRYNGRAQHVPNNDGYTIESFNNLGAPKPIQFTATNDTFATMNIDIANRRVNIGALGYFQLPTSTLSVQGTIDTPQITCRPTDNSLGIGNDTRATPKTITIGTQQDTVNIPSLVKELNGGRFSGYFDINTGQSATSEWTTGIPATGSWKYSIYPIVTSRHNAAIPIEVGNIAQRPNGPYGFEDTGSVKFWFNIPGFDWNNRVIEWEYRTSTDYSQFGLGPYLPGYVYTDPNTFVAKQFVLQINNPVTGAQVYTTSTRIWLNFSFL